MTQASVFSPSRRIVPCESCARPVEPETSDTLTCAACGAVQTLGPRPETEVPRGAASGAGDDVRRRVLGDRELAARVGDAQAGRMEPVRAAWLGFRASLAEAGTDPDGEMRLVLLTTVLANAALDAGDDRQLRALLEGALEAVRAPGHRQALRGWLARQASRLGDLPSAERWLEGCDPTSADPTMDGIHRVSRAQLATAVGDAHAVLELLGLPGEARALPASVAGLAAILRANALEKTGRLELACAELRAAATTVAERMSQADTLAHLPAAWAVCARSFDAESRRRALERIARGRYSVPWVMVGALGLVALTAVTALEGGDALVVGISGVGAAVMALAAFFQRRWHARQRAIVAAGRLLRARVRHDPRALFDVRHMESAAGGTRGLRFEIDVVDELGEPRRTLIAPYLTVADAKRVNGAEIPVLFDPAHPDEAVLAL